MKNPFKGHKNLFRAVLSVFVAFFLWAFVMSEVDPVISKTIYRVPVTYEGLDVVRDKDYALANSEEVTTNITVRGKRKAVNSLSPDEVSASLDLSNVVPGNQSLKIKVSVNNSQVSFVEAEPANLAIEVDEIVTKTFPIDIRSTGDLPEGYVLDETVMSREEVEVRGPKKTVDRINRAVANIDLTDREESTTVSSAIMVLDEQDNPLSEGLSLKEPTTDIQISISKTASVPIEIQYAKDLPDDFLEERVSLTPATVGIAGEAAVVDKIRKVETEELDPEALMEGQTHQVSLVIPEGVRLVNPTDTYLVRYELGQVMDRTLEYPIRDIRILGGSKDNVTINQAGSIQVKIRGEEQLLEAMEVSDLNLSLDIENLSPGRHRVKIRPKGPENLEIISLDPDTLDIRVKRQD